uniref:Uncharacterized protein LOC104219702 n=1 Tax=Nicotiana sylvestris TaxID=4096 RepID=A0A1U7VUU3_NICSY|nr:PREDICTED: uncharacterized protein LOC104219702 [Nicotiana sylvestris]
MKERIPSLERDLICKKLVGNWKETIPSVDLHGRNKMRQSNNTIQYNRKQPSKHSVNKEGSIVWDEQGRSEIAKIFVSYGPCYISSLQFLFVENGTWYCQIDMRFDAETTYFPNVG